MKIQVVINSMLQINLKFIIVFLFISVALFLVEYQGHLNNERFPNGNEDTDREGPLGGLEDLGGGEGLNILAFSIFGPLPAHWD